MCGSPLSRSSRRLREARLADARLARNQHDAALAGLGLLPAPLQQRQLLLAADQRRAGRAQRLEAALGPALAQHPRGHDRRGQALDLDRAEILIVEQPAGQPPRARRDHHRARLGQRLQPRREVRRLADDPAFLRFALADEIAHDHQAGGDADPHLQWRRRDGVEPGHLLDQLQRRAHRALGIVLVGPRIAEIGEHAVAHVLGDKPAAAPDHLGDAAVIGADHRAQILGSSRADSAVEPTRSQNMIVSWRRSARRAGPAADRPRLHGGLGAQRGDRLEKLAPMATKCHPEILEVLRRELRQHVPIDLVITQRLVVTLKTKAAQPYRYVHAVILGSEERQPLMDDDSSK